MARRRPQIALASRVAFAAAFVLLPAPARSALGAATADLSAARALFERNLDAIRRRDRGAYLACYLKSDSLARTGPEGFRLGYRALAEEPAGWPDVFEARDLRLVPVRDGLVYGTYRYRVRFGDQESAGISERLFLRTDAGWRIAVTSAFPAPAGTPPPSLALVGGTLVDGTGRAPVRNAVVVLRAGQIECAGPRASCPVPDGIDTLDMRGLWITPGLVDAHVHYSQSGWADGRPDALDLRERFPYEQTQRELREHPERFHRAYLCSGVTSVFDVGGYAWTLDLQQATATDTRSPRVVAAGPVLSTLDHWLNLGAERQFIYLAGDSAARAGVRYLKARGAAAVKVWFIVTGERDFDEMERAVAAVGTEARHLGLPLIVHATGLREAKAALRAGARVLVHSVWDAPVDDEFLNLAKQRAAVYCPTLTVLDGYTRLFEGVRRGVAPRVDDPHGCVDSTTRARIASTPRVARALGYPARLGPRADQTERKRIMAENLRRVHRAAIPIATGTDAGNPLTLHGPAIHAEMEAMQRAGLRPMEVLIASTAGGALAMGRTAEIGTIEAGKAADLLVVAGDPTVSIANLRRVRWVVRGGVARSLAELHY